MLKNTLNEFKTFALRGNAVDLAVGVVIGAAFGEIVTSLVTDIINPFIGLLTGGIDFSHKIIVLKSATETTTAITLDYGSFITSLINFVIVAFAIFLVIKQLTKLIKKEAKSPSTPPKPTKDQELLTEIRDALKK